MEALDNWEQHARSAYEHFEKDGNRAIIIDELASVSLIVLVFESISIIISGFLSTQLALITPLIVPSHSIHKYFLKWFSPRNCMLSNETCR